MKIELRRAALTYQALDGEVAALRDVTFGVADGEFVSIVGPSGCGKSTLLALIAGIERPSGGEVLVDGEPVRAPTGKAGLMPQRDQLFDWRTIWGNVTLGLEIRHENTPVRRDAVRALLTQYRLDGFARKLPNQLSGGMRQRCALIRTLATSPDVLLLDEPFSALDYQTRLAVSGDIAQIIRRSSRTIFPRPSASRTASSCSRTAPRPSRPSTISARCAPCRRCSGAAGRNFRRCSIKYGRSWMSMPERSLSPQRLAYLRAQKRRRRVVLVLQVLLLAAFLGWWELAARCGWVDAFIVSSPSRVVRTLAALQSSGELWLHIGTSCLEVVAGFLLGTLLGTLIAIGLWWSELLSRVLDPYLVVLNALPKTALGPVFIVWIGAGTGSIIAMTVAISLFVTILNMHVGFLSTDREKIRLMQTLGATRHQILWRLVIPANYATLFNTLRVNVGLSWVGVIMGEFLVSKAGLGYLIVYGSQVFNMDLVMATVFVLAAAAVVMYQLVLWLEKGFKKRLGVTQ